MINTAANAFGDIAEAFERALSAPRGIRIPCASRGAAMRLRQRFNYFRKLDRLQNRDIYAKDDPQYGLSVYDRLELRIPPKGDPKEYILYIVPRLVGDLPIEEIEPTPDPARPPEIP